MTERELAKALLELHSTDTDSAPGDAEMTQRVLDKDRKRVRLLAWVTGLCWAGSLMALYTSTFLLVMKYHGVLTGKAMDVDPQIADLVKQILITQGSLEAAIFALLCTLLMMFISRRATLRQVNVSLLEISSRLKDHN